MNWKFEKRYQPSWTPHSQTVPLSKLFLVLVFRVLYSLSGISISLIRDRFLISFIDASGFASLLTKGTPTHRYLPTFILWILWWLHTKKTTPKKTERTSIGGAVYRIEIQIIPTPTGEQSGNGDGKVFQLYGNAARSIEHWLILCMCVPNKMAFTTRNHRRP